jgi:ribosome-binding protein aMBF1 (putative translation factor)
MDHQDWNTVTVRNTRRPAGGAGASASGGPRRAVTNEARIARELDGDDMPRVHVKRLSAESRQQIVAARVAKSWDQGRLNTMCSFPPHTIREIEAGRAHPSPGQLNVLNRVLQIALRYE